MPSLITFAAREWLGSVLGQIFEGTNLARGARGGLFVMPYILCVTVYLWLWGSHEYFTLQTVYVAVSVIHRYSREARRMHRALN